MHACSRDTRNYTMPPVDVILVVVAAAVATAVATAVTVPESTVCGLKPVFTGKDIRSIFQCAQSVNSNETINYF